MKRMFLFSGVNGPNASGNQSMKNTLIGYLDAGYTVWHFSFRSNGEKACDFPALLARRGYRHFGMPRFVMDTLKAGSRAGRRGSEALPAEASLRERSAFPDPRVEIDLGTSEVSLSQCLVAAFCWCIDLCRALLPALLLRPKICYGYEVYGIGAAWTVGRLSGAAVVSRYQGTYVTRSNLDFAPIRFHRFLMRRLPDVAVMANDGTKGLEVLEREGVPVGRVYFAANGIDPFIETYRPEPSVIEGIRGKYLGDADFLLGVFNRYYPFKRIDRAIWLLKVYRDAGIKVRLLAGGGGGPLKEALKAHADELGLADQLVWADHIPFRSMPAHYLACDAVLVVNDYANSGNQIMECLWLGAPLAATDDGNNAKLFGDCRKALFFQIGDPPMDWDRLAEIMAPSPKYSSPHLYGWAERMRKEVAWVESRL